MPVIYKLRGQMAEFAELGLNLYSGCAIGCQHCTDPSALRMTREQWINAARPRRNVLFLLKRDAKNMEGDPRDISSARGPNPTNRKRRPS